MSKETIANSVTGEIELPANADGIAIPSRRHEILAVIATLIALVLLMALLSYDGLEAAGSPVLGGNLIGPVGTWVAFVAFYIMGAGAYLLDFFVWAYAAYLFTGRAGSIRISGILGVIAIALLSAIGFHTFMEGATLAGGHSPGGLVGGILGEFSISLISVPGTYVLTVGGILLVILLSTDISLFLAARAVGLSLAHLAKGTVGVFARIATAWKETPGHHEDPRDVLPAPIVVVDNTDKKKKPEAPAPEPPPVDEDPAEPKIVSKAKKKATKSNLDELEEIVISDAAPRGEFILPSTDLLDPPQTTAAEIDTEYLQEMARRLVQVLTDFGISGTVKEIQPGPVVTMFEFQPRSGTKLSKIGGLSSEIAMALEVKRVRVVTPIPGKNAVGFELPNKTRQMVSLREIIEDPSFRASKLKLPMALGKDISGNPFTVDLAKMPHLLMAGTTGSGKSVSVNTMLLSMLYRYTPDELRLLLIDPKMIEFQPYNHIPHLLLPVVTDMSQACLALKWAVDEMERRYQLFADFGSRNLDSYNKKVEKIRDDAKALENELLAEAQTETTEDGTLVEFGAVPMPIPKIPEKLPLIVICIDELADLMMVAAKDVEVSIARLAQKARAAGLHLIVATQRPSTDVVTGLIKANFPARLSCQVSCGIDSRTILGTNGAENLLGNGDMLIVPPGTSDLKRVQGAYVSEEEVAAVVEFLKSQGKPSYDTEILKPREDEGSGGIDEEEKDEVYDQAVAIVAEAQACSISMIQRRLRIGYNRAARIVEIMEKEGVVGPANGVNKRDVLVSQF